ncbi:MAG: DNA-binding protein [Eubacteriaceae bacterium]|jgi:hypothetical protein|nr:DNA-binding protein [Eubacteriaceae bacterium]
MKAIYFTIVGTKHYYGDEVFEHNKRVKLIKEPDNKFDKEAIQVKLPGLGVCGYVANSPCTVLGESYSAGRLYDKFGDKVNGRVLYKTEKGILCVLNLHQEEVTIDDLNS